MSTPLAPRRKRRKSFVEQTIGSLAGAMERALYAEELAKAATDGMRFMYVAGYQFIKAGVILVDLQSASVQQRELDLGDPNEPPATRDRSRLMAAMDVINTRFGKGTVHSGGTGKPGTNRVWTMKQERRTPAYTTNLADVPVARA